MSDPVGQKLHDAAWEGCASEVSSLLRDQPEINVNWSNPLQWTPLHATSFNGHVEVAKLLLAHPNINVNLKDSIGQTPLLFCCQWGHVSLVRLLLKDPRVDVALNDEMGHTPLWCASCNGRHEVIENLIASGRDLGDIENKKGRDWDNIEFTALEIARNRENSEVVSVLEKFIANPAQTRHELRVKLGVPDALAAEVFALTVFLCDELLQPKPVPHLAATRFFAIAAKLPMELQMILCHRVVGSMKQNILRMDSEAAFKSLTRILPLDSQSK